MANYITTDTELTSIANAIRTKGGTSAQLVYPSGFVSAIQAIQTSSGGGGTTTWETMYDASTWIVSSDPNYFIISDYTTPIQAGETYRVTWGTGGTQYICETGQDHTGTTYDGYYFGNLGLVGYPDNNTGEPFFFYRDSANQLLGVTNTSGGQSIYITIEKQTTSSGGSTPSLQAKTNINPTTSSQTITADSGYDGLSSVQINAMPTGTVTAPSSISGTSATVSTGTNTLTLTKSVSVTPNVTTAGYVSSGTAGNASVSLTASVTTKAAATITPGTTNQTIASGTYLTGVQTIAGDSNLVSGNILSGKSIFGVQGGVTFQTYYTGSSTPASSLGVNGDIYLMT